MVDHSKLLLDYLLFVPMVCNKFRQLLLQVFIKPGELCMVGWVIQMLSVLWFIHVGFESFNWVYKFWICVYVCECVCMWVCMCMGYIHTHSKLIYPIKLNPPKQLEFPNLISETNKLKTNENTYLERFYNLYYFWIEKITNCIFNINDTIIIIGTELIFSLKE